MAHEQSVRRETSQTEPQHIRAAENAAKALDMRIAGHGFRAIATALGVSLGSAHAYVSKALAELREVTAEKAEELREIELQRLDHLIQLATARMGADCSDADLAKLMNTVRGLSESRRKLTGLDAPVKIETTGKLYTVAAASPECEEWNTPQGQGAERANDGKDHEAGGGAAGDL